MPAAIVQTPRKNMRQRTHQHLDVLLDFAEREQLWGEIKPEILIQGGAIVKIEFPLRLGEKATS